jgi:hypothetical protein
MSGAALWIGDQIVGILARHYPSDGLGRLTAVRIDKLVDELGLHDEYQRALEIAPALGRLSVSPVGHQQIIASTTYRFLVQDIAPNNLIDRDTEYDLLVQFCAGSEPFLWWQAGPWAGKSALMSWFVLHPPAYVDIVSFFVTGRLVGQADSDAFTDAIIVQLAAITDESVASVLTAAARHGTMLRLIEAAATRLEEYDRRLVIVVDGLDEDVGPRGDILKPSILSLLPRRLHPNARIILASRPDPPMPNDVPADHPIRHLAPQILHPSPYARNLEINARNEMQRLLDGLSLQRELLGLITACGGGLTKQDLETLTSRKLYEIDRLLSGVFGRTVGSRRLVDRGDGRSERVYLFTHETIRVVALEQFGEGALTEYSDRIRAWADSYQNKGWPQSTPSYLLRGYQQMLANLNDSTRLTACATDELRQDAMLRATGGDALALTELRSARDLELQSSDVNIGSLLLLAAHRDYLIQRNSRLPVGLPALWVMLGQPARGEALAAPITDPMRLAVSLVRLAESSAISGDGSHAIELVKQAESVLATMTGDVSQGQNYFVVLGIAKALALAGQNFEAELAISRISDPARRVRAVSKLAECASISGDSAWAINLARKAEAELSLIDSEYWQGDTLASLLEVHARAGNSAHADDLLSKIKSTIARADALARLADLAAQVGDFARAERMVENITLDHILAESVSRLGAAATDKGADDKFTSRISDPAARISLLCSRSEAAAKGGDAVLAGELLARAETLLDRIADAERRADYAVRLGSTAARLGYVERASALAR